MKVSNSWKPQRSLAGLLGIFAASCVLFLAIGTDQDLRVVLEKAAAVALIAAVAGYVCGYVLKYLIRELPEPAPREFLKVPDSMAVESPRFPGESDRADAPAVSSSAEKVEAT